MTINENLIINTKTKITDYFKKKFYNTKCEIIEGNIETNRNINY